jgi:hypothetical protein
MDFYSMSLTFFKLSDRSACRTFKFLHRHSVLTVQRACKRIIWRPDEVSNGKPVLTSPCVTSAFLFFSNFTVLYQRLATASSTFLRYANLFELLKEKKRTLFYYILQAEPCVSYLLSFATTDSRTYKKEARGFYHMVNSSFEVPISFSSWRLTWTI